MTATFWAPGRVNLIGVEAALDAGAIGARMTGGGFGSVVAVAERNRTDAVLSRRRTDFRPGRA